MECILKLDIDDIETKRLAGKIYGESNDANAGMFIPFIVFNREETIEHLKRTKDLLTQLVS
jgi:hypothetical protein